MKTRRDRAEIMVQESGDGGKSTELHLELIRSRALTRLLRPDRRFKRGRTVKRGAYLDID